MVIPRVHGDTKEKNAESPAHIYSYVDREGGTKGRTNFMQDFSTKENMATVAYDPNSNTPSRQNVNDPVRVDAFKGFSEIR